MKHIRFLCENHFNPVLALSSLLISPALHSRPDNTLDGGPARKSFNPFDIHMCRAEYRWHCVSCNLSLDFIYFEMLFNVLVSINSLSSVLEWTNWKKAASIESVGRSFPMNTKCILFAPSFTCEHIMFSVPFLSIQCHHFVRFYEPLYE